MDPEEFDDDYDYDAPLDCACEGYDADILTGIASCWRCGNCWHMTGEEIRRELQFIAEYAEQAAEEQR